MMSKLKYLFKHALTRQPAPNIAEGLTQHPELGAPDAALTTQQHSAYLHTLHRLGLEVTILPPDPHFPDGHYVEDTAVILGDMAFITCPTEPSRQGEPEAIVEALEGLRIVRMAGTEGRLEGGDVLFCHDRVLIGLSERTNLAGAEQLKAALQSVDPDLPVDFVPFTGVLHLKTGMTQLVPKVLLKSPEMQTDFDFSFADVITLPPEEGYAANVIPVNGAVMIPEGYPTVEKLAEKYYEQIIKIPMSEFRKMDGGLTCLSLRW